MHQHVFETTVGGKQLTATFSNLAEQANGSVMITLGETTLFVTAVMSAKPTTLPYLPLSVEFEEKFYAAGAILGNQFQRREGRPSDGAVLNARIVDRTIRPLFPAHLRHEVQVIVSVLAIGEDDPDVVSVIGASLALAVSDIPWSGPVSAVRLGLPAVGGDVMVNPTYEARTPSILRGELLACGQGGTINMIEAATHEVGEAEVSAALTAALSYLKDLENWQQSIVAAIGQPKRTLEAPAVDERVAALFREQFATRLYDTIFSNTAGKRHIHALGETFLEAAAAAELPEAGLWQYFEEQVNEVLHRGVVEDGKRPDGRSITAVRSLFAQAGGISPVLHGSGIFYRGGTHIFTALTLGGPGDSQIVDTIEDRDTKRSFMHHYNFPPFSVGETGRVGGTNRRMLGHGALAEKALAPVIPPQSDFPYTIRLVSETLASNGSSSMGSVCASTLALMDGGVPITRPVAGIASGVMIAGDRYTLLTDIQGPEDEHGDMDFKVAGTRVGITAIQMDVKVGGIPVPMLTEALAHAKAARETILDTLEAAIATPRATISPRAPEIVSLTINPDQIGLVIGSGGKTINGIKDETGVADITIEEDGRVYITGRNGTASKARERIANLTKVYTIGERATAVVTKLTDFGAFVKLPNGSEGLVHISELVPFRVEKVADILSLGETIETVVVKLEQGKIGLSLKQADPEFATRKGIVPQST